MKKKGKTIKMLLPDGNLEGVKIAEVTTKTVQAILIPRSLLNTVKDIKEIQNAGLYFLFGNNNEETQKLTYIGGAEIGFDGLKEQNNTEDFWDVAVLFVSISSLDQFSKVDLKFLEHLACTKADSVGKSFIDQTVSTKICIPEGRRDDLLDVFENIVFLLGALGYPID
jgi:hypothetical protein